MRSFTSGVESSMFTWACSSPALARSSAIPRSTSSPLVLIATAMPYSDAYPTTSASPRLPRASAPLRAGKHAHAQVREPLDDAHPSGAQLPPQGLPGRLIAGQAPQIARARQVDRDRDRPPLRVLPHNERVPGAPRGQQMRQGAGRAVLHERHLIAHPPHGSASRAPAIYGLAGSRLAPPARMSLSARAVHLNHGTTWDDAPSARHNCGLNG